jgi:hypothetical protein
MRHSSQTIEKIKQLRINGLTLTEIISETGLSKSTVLGYICNVPKSKFLVEKIYEIKLKTQNRVAAERRGKSLKTNSFVKPENWNTDFVNLVSHFLFDGSVSRVSCSYNNRSLVMIENVILLMKKCLDIDDYKVYKNNTTGVTKVSCHNVELATFVKEKIENLLEYILLAPRDEKISFLRAFFDDEGTITFRKNIKAVRGYQHSIRILKIVGKLLNDVGIKNTIYNNYYEVSISRKENLIKFQKFINFTPGLRVNGKRTNSIWKKDLEKREILRMAIDSYLPV